jgi:hypothetical protein
VSSKGIRPDYRVVYGWGKSRDFDTLEEAQRFTERLRKVGTRKDHDPLPLEATIYVKNSDSGVFKKMEEK